MNSLDYYSYRLIGKLTAFFAASGVQLPESNRGTFHFKRAVFLGQIKTKIGSNLAKTAVLSVNFNIDGAPSHHARILTHLTHRRLAC